MNQVILVGRINKFDKLAGIISIECRREGTDETDRVPIKFKDELLEVTKEHLEDGMTIGVKATLKVDNNVLRIIADKVIFISKKE
ncbi:MAG: hypothetical protein WC154_00320 [Candidatus Izemoplasmatales bacterium]